MTAVGGLEMHHRMVLMAGWDRGQAGARLCRQACKLCIHKERSARGLECFRDLGYTSTEEKFPGTPWKQNNNPSFDESKRS